MASVPKAFRNIRTPKALEGTAKSGAESIFRQKAHEGELKSFWHGEAHEINKKVDIQRELNKNRGTKVSNTAIANSFMKKEKTKGDYQAWNGTKYITHNGTSNKYMKNNIVSSKSSGSNVNTGEGLSMLKDYQQASKHVPNADPNKTMNTKMLSHDMKSNFHASGGWGDVGRSAVRGAAVGGLAGGGLEAAQGGDFWEGAKSGAMMGGTGMAGMRIARQATGARSYFGNGGIAENYGQMKKDYGVGVKALVANQKHVRGATDWVTGNTPAKRKAAREAAGK